MQIYWIFYSVAVLNTINGVVITSRPLKHCNRLLGVSVDMSDNIFVCANTNIVVLSSDLKNEHVLFNMGHPSSQAIAYGKKKHQLMISHGSSDSLGCLQLS